MTAVESCCHRHYRFGRIWNFRQKQMFVTWSEDCTQPHSMQSYVISLCLLRIHDKERINIGKIINTRSNATTNKAYIILSLNQRKIGSSPYEKFLHEINIYYHSLIWFEDKRLLNSDNLLLMV